MIRGVIDERQRRLLQDWLPGAEVVKDHSWGLVGTTVLELMHDGTQYVAKAGDSADHHITRELRAHNEWLEPWTKRGRAAQLVQADAEAKLLLTRYLPGELVEDGEYELLPDVYFQGGELLAQFHAQLSVPDREFEAREKRKTLKALGKPHRITPELTERLRAEVESWPTPEVMLVPTHGDWQPRNWLIHQGIVSVIDFGRADLRPALTDFGRLAAQQFRQNPALESAFLRGYGADPREPGAWHRNRLREAIGTAVWAYQVHDVPFEQQGHRMIAEALADALD